MRLVKDDLKKFNEQYEFLLCTTEDEGEWTGLFDFGGDTANLGVIHNESEGVFELYEGWHGGDVLGNVPTSNKKYLKKVVEYLMDGDISSIPSSYFL